MFLVEVVGGIALGLLLGWITYRLLKSIDDYDVEVIITTAAVMGGTVLAQYFHLSAPLAMVTAGLIVGMDTVRETSMSKVNEHYVDKFWELIEILLNMVLFVMISMEILILTFNNQYILGGLLLMLTSLLARYLSLMFPIKIYAKKLVLYQKLI